MATEKRYLAHSRNSAGFEEPLRDHLIRVAERARSYASELGHEEEGFLAGLLHDFGKYGDLFQKRLRGEARGIDHWSAGAWVSLTRYMTAGFLSALAIHGHHIGLQSGSKDFLRSIEPSSMDEKPDFYKCSGSDLSVLERRFIDDGLVFPVISDTEGVITPGKWPAMMMLDARMLFSALTDADFIETEAHFQGDRQGPVYTKPEPPELNAKTNLPILLSFIEELAEAAEASERIKACRAQLLDACLKAAENPVGLFTCTAPTGSGKTLSLFAFAMKHAAEHELKRIIVVIPYLTIIEQTARVYRKALARTDLGDQVLEHHSLTGSHLTGNDPTDESSVEERLSENWDSPIIITTSVQFLHSLLSNRPSLCRKLHNVANSVVLFDEVQTLPLRIALPTLATLASLTERYNTTVVFSTATQPAFSLLDQAVAKYTPSGWSPKEIVPSYVDIHSGLNRVLVHWPGAPDEALTIEELAYMLLERKDLQVLCILNLKRHALELFDRLDEQDAPGLFHLSTSMCPRHRSRVLDEVRKRLARRDDCLLVSTQCVEAGVDIDFPVVFRSWGPLDSIAQAAGRCNRRGLAENGEMHVFRVRDESGKRLYPDGAYEQAASVTSLVLRNARTSPVSVDDPALYKAYFSTLYEFAKLDEMNKDLLDAVKRLDFIDVAKKYRVIEETSISALVPCESSSYDYLAAEVREKGLTAKWIREARPHAVALFRPKPGDTVQGYLEPVPTRDGPSIEWFIYLNIGHYDPRTGLRMPEDSSCWIG